MTATRHPAERTEATDGRVLRPVSPGDLPACADVFYVSVNELNRRTNQPPAPPNEAGMVTLFAHLLATDPSRAWLAQAPNGQVEGFAFAHLRQQTWFLSFLFVRPAAQAQGLGRRLLLRTFPHDPGLAADDGTGGASAFPGVLGTCVDSVQPVSTALYAGYGLVPRVPLFTCIGRPRPGRSPALPSTVERLTFEQLSGSPDNDAALAEAVDAIDSEVVGHTRQEDHGSWRVSRREGSLFRDRTTGMPLGYGYVQATGRLGPVAVRDPGLLPAVVGALMGVLQPAGEWQVFVPGIAGRTLVALLAAGLRLEGTPAIHCSSRPHGVDLTRYIPASFALL